MSGRVIKVFFSVLVFFKLFWCWHILKGFWAPHSFIILIKNGTITFPAASMVV